MNTEPDPCVLMNSKLLPSMQFIYLIEPPPPPVV